MDTGDGNDDALNAMGVGIDTLSSSDLSVLDQIVERVDIMEIHSPKRVAELAVKFGLVAGACLDLTTGYDFDSREDQERAWNIVRTDKPALLIGSPPCTYFSMLQELHIAVPGKNDDWMRKFRAQKEKRFDTSSSVATFTGFN